MKFFGVKLRIGKVQYFSMKPFFKINLLIFAGLFVFSCGKKDTTGTKADPVLAKVGGRVITASEFKYSYEFSFASLRKGSDNPRRTYLDYMIKERLLANEGFRLGFNQKRYVTSRLARRRRNDLLEAFYQKHVHRKVRIPEDQLQQAIKRGTVKWRMILWPEPTLQAAEETRLKARQTSLEKFIEKKMADQEIQIQEKTFFETDWIDFLDMRPEVLDQIKNLKIGDVSTPIPMGDNFVLAQILDINLQGIKSDELNAGVKRKQMYARLHNIAADSIARSLMDSVLTPLDIRVRGSRVHQLAQPLYDWVQAGLPTQSLTETIRQATDTSQAYLQQLQQMLDQPIVTAANGHKTVADYLDFANYYRSPLNQVKSAPFKVFQDQVVMEIGRMLKDEIFYGIAETEGFADSAGIKHDLRIWEEKWTYDTYRSEVVKDLTVTPEEMQAFWKSRWRELGLANVDTTRMYKYESDVYNFILHEKHIARLDEKLAELRQQYPVWINAELLNQLELNDSSKTILTSYFVRKNFSGEAVVPTADLKWINF